MRNCVISLLEKSELVGVCFDDLGKERSMSPETCSLAVEWC
jgi:hypothetical protein